MPWSKSIRFTVFRPISWPRLARGTPDAGVAPSRILDGYPHNHLGNRLGCQRPTTTTVGAAVVLLRDQSPIPAQDGVRRDDAGHLRQNPPPELLPAYGETTALRISQAERTAAQLLSEAPIRHCQLQLPAGRVDGCPVTNLAIVAIGFPVRSSATRCGSITVRRSKL